MNVNTKELAECFQDGLIRGVLWNAETIQCAALCLPNIEHLPELALIDNHFVDETSFRSLLQLLLQHHRHDLVRLYIAQDDISPLLQDMAQVFSHAYHYTKLPTTTASSEHFYGSGTLQELELVSSRGKIRDADALHLRQIVQIPSQSLSLSFNLKQKDYGPCLLALRQGLDDIRALHQQTNGKDAPNNHLVNVSFRNVSFPDHEFHLHRFVAMVCEAQCVDSLHVTPRRRRAADATESMRVGPGFCQALARLFAFGRVRSLQISNVVLDSPVDERTMTELYQALLRNTTLERLSMPFTKGMACVWQHAIFPALQDGNRSLQRVEFGHEVGLVHSFLQHLPYMKGLQSVQAPWRTHEGPSWMAAVQQSDTLVQANLIPLPDLTSCPVIIPTNDELDASPAALPPASSTSSSTPPLEHQMQGLVYHNEKPVSPSSFGQPEKQDFCLKATRQLVERNRLTRLARTMVRTESSPTCFLNHLASMTQTEAGLDARFVILRETLSLFVH